MFGRYGLFPDVPFLDDGLKFFINDIYGPIDDLMIRAMKCANVPIDTADKNLAKLCNGYNDTPREHAAPITIAAVVLSAAYLAYRHWNSKKEEPVPEVAVRPKH